jgi:hypothetical protein
MDFFEKRIVINEEPQENWYLITDMGSEELISEDRKRGGTEMMTVLLLAIRPQK